MPFLACLLFVLSLVCTPSAAFAWLTDTETHLPPVGGCCDYETFTPADPTFPDVNETYVDPVFNESIRRLTNIYPLNAGTGILYGLNGFWNADGTAFLHHTVGHTDVIVLDPRNGTVLRTGVPYPFTTTDAVSFDPVNRAVYYYTAGHDLRQYDWTTGVDSTLVSFPQTLGGLGQSADWIDRSGRYFLLNLDGQLRLWDKQQRVLYSGSVPVPTGSNGIPPGWAGLSPDSKYVILSLNPQKYSYRVDHTNRRLLTTAVLFWDACFDHGDVMSASDGYTYMITGNCLYNNEDAFYRVRVTNNVAGQGAAQLTMAGNRRLLTLQGGRFSAVGGHHACAAKGSMSDWCYSTDEDNTDQLGNIGPWWPYKQEIMLIHMVSPFEVRRLVHHRSRPILEDNFCRTPRVSASWDGTAVIFSSPYATPPSGGCGYSDIYRWEVPQQSQPSNNDGEPDDD